MSTSKCEMARHELCRKSEFGYCIADDKDLENCPYLKAIGEIARLIVEDIIYDDDRKYTYYI